MPCTCNIHKSSIKSSKFGNSDISQPQYVFIHDALLEAIECGESEVAARDLRDQYMRLGEVDEVQGKTRFQMEYEVRSCCNC